MGNLRHLAHLDSGAKKSVQIPSPPKKKRRRDSLAAALWVKCVVSGSVDIEAGRAGESANAKLKPVLQEIVAGRGRERAGIVANTEVGAPTVIEIVAHATGQNRCADLVGRHIFDAQARAATDCSDKARENAGACRTGSESRAPCDGHCGRGDQGLWIIHGQPPELRWLIHPPTADPSQSGKSSLLDGRGDRIRTYDLRYPKPSRYQAALRPDVSVIRRGGRD